jgi:hypothetical protein
LAVKGEAMLVASFIMAKDFAAVMSNNTEMVD